MSTSLKKRLPVLALVAGLAAAVLAGVYLHADLGPGRSAASPGAAGQAPEPAEDEKAPIPVTTAPVTVEDVSAYVSATSNLVPESEVEVLAETEGRVAIARVEEGDRVGSGTVLAELDRREGEIALEKAKLRAATTGQAHERSRQLLERELLSPEAYEKVALEHELATQELAEARWRLEKTFIRSPFAGRLVQRLVQAGQHVRRGDRLFTVADFDPLVARVYLPERDVLGLAEGRAVRIRLRADEGVEFDGRIRQISPVVDTTTGTVKVTIETRAAPAAVRPGAFVRIDVVRETIPGALLIPREAVLRELQKTHVFVARDGVAERRQVDLGLEEGGRVEVRSGLEAGERVIVAGQGALEDGARVRAREVAAKPAAS